jgi:cold shock CspA family protein
MIEGVCTHWQGFFGFIEGDDGVNYFAHQTAIRTAKKGEFRMLIPGERYKFQVAQAERGPMAIGIVRIL